MTSRAAVEDVCHSSTQTQRRRNMFRTLPRRVLVLALVASITLVGLVGLGRLAARSASTPSAHAATPASVTVFATGLSNPRGLTFGPDGTLYVAEGGPATN